MNLLGKLKNIYYFKNLKKGDIVYVSPARSHSYFVIFAYIIGDGFSGHASRPGDDWMTAEEMQSSFKSGVFKYANINFNFGSDEYYQAKGSLLIKKDKVKIKTFLEKIGRQ